MNCAQGVPYVIRIGYMNLCFSQIRKHSHWHTSLIPFEFRGEDEDDVDKKEEEKNKKTLLNEFWVFTEGLKFKHAL